MISIPLDRGVYQSYLLRKKCFLERSAVWNKIISEKSSSFDFFLSRCLFRNDFTPFLERFKPDVTSQRELLSDSCSWHLFLEMLLWYIRLMKQLLSIMITKWVMKFFIKKSKGLNLSHSTHDIINFYRANLT